MKIPLRRDCCEALQQHFPDLKIVEPFTRVQGVLPPTATCVIECTEQEARSYLEIAQRSCPDCVNPIEEALKYPLR
jgi:hypothetical protein